MTTQHVLEEAGRSIHRRDAELLLGHVLRQDRARLLAHPETELSPEQYEVFTSLVRRRAQHAPLQYLVGHQEFFGLDLHVSPAVLIPRPETELLVEAVLAWVAAAPTAGRRLQILDVGTGSGAIALALASRLPAAGIDAVDLSEAALAMAADNAVRLNLATRVRFLRSDLLSALEEAGTPPGSLDVIVSNPPYVPETEAPGLQPEVRDFEPHLALFAGEDGLGVYRRLIPQAHQALRLGGLLAMEIGFSQQPALQALLAGWQNVRFLEDYAAIPRIALAERA